MFAICIWIDDSTVNGSVVSLNKMMLESDPTKPVNPYELKEGDLVKAPCHGFSGLHRCVIAKIGNDGDEVKKEFLRIIDSAEFLKLVEQYASAYFPGFHEPSNQPDKGDDVNTTTEVTANKGNQQGNCRDAKKTKRKRRLDVKKTVVEGATDKTDLRKKKTENTKAEGSETKKKDDQEAKKKAEEQRRKIMQNRLDAAAKELELTELEADMLDSSVSNSDQQPSNSDQQPSKSDQQPSSRSNGFEHSMSSLLIDSIEISYSSQGNSCQNCHLLEGKISCFENNCLQLENKVQSLENNVSTLWNWNRQIQQELHMLQQSQSYWHTNQNYRTSETDHQHQEQNVTSNSATSSSSAATSSSSSASTQSSNIPSVSTASISNTSSAESEEVISGYTVAQLEAKITHFDSFSKAATLLFRTIFTEEEYVGKTLTGANGKPSVDQHKLNIIYNIVKKRFPYLTTAMIRLKLSDLLKPSRSKAPKQI